ncbi:MAG: hypothetical protein IPG96_18855 [Proteobacteria bacterium]|nr:hypothetical protein [Pseudomonadota bacterium]
MLGWIGQLNRISLAKAVLAGTSDVEARVRRSAALALATLRPTPAGSHEALHRMLAAAQGQAEQAWLRLDAATALARLGIRSGCNSSSASCSMPIPGCGWRSSRRWRTCATAAAWHWRSICAMRRPSRAPRALGALARLERTTLGRRARLELLRALQAGAWEERLLAAQALASIAPGRARAALRQALRDGPSDVQLRAALQLARDFADLSASPLLQAALQQPAREDDAIAVALALGRLADPRARQALQAALARPLPLLRLAAAVALLDR